MSALPQSSVTQIPLSFLEEPVHTEKKSWSPKLQVFLSKHKSGFSLTLHFQARVLLNLGNGAIKTEQEKESAKAGRTSYFPMTNTQKKSWSFSESF